MTFMAVACGLLMVVFGFWSTGLRPTESESAIQITCLVGGLILCFLAVVLARLNALALRMELIESALVPPDRPIEDPYAAIDEAVA